MRIFSILSLWLISALFVTCAVKGGLKGGPEDKTPPTIIYSFPQADSTGVHHLEYIRFSFSEMMDRNSIAKNLFISPPIAHEWEWQGYDELSIRLLDSLNRDVTYVLTLGTGLKDLRGNGLEQAYTLAFSSGDHIDHGEISGRVHGLKPKKNYTVMAYLLDSLSQNPHFYRDTALYITKTGKKGNFRLTNLKEGLYRVLAVNDANNNLLADLPREKIALAQKDIPVREGRMADFVSMRPAIQDTNPPVILSVRAINKRQVSLNSNRTLFPDSLATLSIRDSASSQKLALFQWSRAQNALILHTAPQDSGARYVARIAPLRDSLARYTADTSFRFSASRRLLKQSFRIKKRFPADSARAVHPLTNLYLEFSLPLSAESLRHLKQAVVLRQNGDSVSFQARHDSPDKLTLTPSAPLLGDSSYVLTLDSTLLRDAFGRTLKDSATQTVFKVNSPDNFGSLSGRITTALPPPYVVSITRLDGKKEKRVQSLGGKEFEFLFLEEGRYRLAAFADSDSNGVYSPGSIKPFRFSETFHMSADTVSIRKRWEKSGIIIPLP